MILQVTKDAASQTNFYDGLYTTFTATKAGHIRFNFSSTNVNIEDTNLRLKSSSVAIYYLLIIFEFNFDLTTGWSHDFIYPMWVRRLCTSQ